MACSSLCCCFSGEPLNRDEVQQGRGAKYGKYLDYVNKFQINMGDAPLKHPGWCLLGGCPITFCCAQVHMRYKILNHVNPGSEWSNYICCQGYIPACCCFAPGSCCEDSIPRTCMCLEAICCAGLAVSSTRFVAMDFYQLTPDECDNRLIRFNNCLQLLSCICHVLALFNRDFQQLAAIIDLIADIVFFMTAGCMTAQVDYEIKYRNALGSAPGGPAPLPVATANPVNPPIATVVSSSGAPPDAAAMDR